MIDKNNYNSYWGILHFHIHGELCHYQDVFTKKMLSEAQRQIDEVHQFARDEMKYDFLSYADHHDMGKMVELGQAENSPWNLVLQAWEKYNQDGKFATILGYEYQDRTAEYNVYLNRSDTRPDGPMFDDLIASVPQGQEGVILAAHNRPRPTDWKFARHANFRQVEIINDGGLPFEDWVVDGLNAGHKFGFIGGSDDHSCRPGLNSSTCVWASKLSRQGVWDALWNRRTVATTGIRPKIWFELNAHAMGSEVACDGKRTLSVTHAFDHKPEWVGIIKNGRLLEQYRPSEADFSFSFEDSGPDKAMDFYYLKIIYADGNYAFASPIWVSAKNAPENTERKTKTKTPAQPPAKYKLEKEFGQRIGRSYWFNAAGLPSGELSFSKSFRDMTIHLGPDSILAMEDGSLAYPTMDAVVQTAVDGTDPKTIYTFTPEDKNLIITSLCTVGETILAGGYLDGQPIVKTLRGPEIAIFKEFSPVGQYFSNFEFVSPSYLASDGKFFCVLCDREGVLFTSQGKPIGYFQDGYQGFPASVRMRSLDEIYVLDFDGYLMRYSFAAASRGHLVWKKKLDGHTLSLALTQDGVLVYNGAIESHIFLETTKIHRVFSDGSDGGVFELDLMNMRGTSIVELNEGRLATMHNSNRKVSATDRDRLNETGTIRVFKK